ncbi:MAG: CNNM domain-containing protein, partial [Planctomycetes bacterium]|nr:CNNM domain-containing protein [Planctomycetota bacterium]
LLANFAATILCRALLRVTVAPDAGEVLNTLVLTPVLFVLGEVTPKNLFRLRANRWVYRASGLLALAGIVLRPPALLLRWLGRLSGVLPTRSSSPDEILSRTQIEALAQEVAADGVLTADQGRMVRNILRLSSVRVTAAMTPIREEEVLASGFARADVVRIGAKGDLNCLPVRRAEGGDYVGFVDVLDLVFRPDDPPAALVRPARRVPETASAGEAMRMLGRDRAKLCFVVRSDGSVAGTATARGLSELIAGKL